MKTDFAQLKHASDTYRQFLRNGELQIFDISGLDRIGIPVFVAAFQGNDGFLNNGVGYGNSSAEAMVGALGEMSETYHVFHALKTAATCESISYKAMVKCYGSDHVIDPLTLCLSAGYPYTEDIPLRWVAVNRFDDGARCWAPRESVAFSGYAYEMVSTCVELQGTETPAKLFPPITCGLGAGVSLEQALSHGVLELLQRDGNCTAFRAMDKGVDIDLDLIENKEINQTLLHLRKLGLHVRAKLASLEFGLTNLYVIAESNGDVCTSENIPILVTACGEAVHPNRERALSKALNEFISSRSRKFFMHGPLEAIKAIVPQTYFINNLDRALPHLEEPKAISEMAIWLKKSEHQLVQSLKHSVFSSHKTIKFSELESTPDEHVLDPRDRLDHVAQKLKNQDISVYYFEGSSKSSDGPKVVKVIAPGLEGETLSYWRIGYRGAKRLLADSSSLVTQAAPQAQHLLVQMSSSQQDMLGGPVYLKIPELEKILNGHYPLYREPSAHTVQKFMNINEY